MSNDSIASFLRASRDASFSPLTVPEDALALLKQIPPIADDAVLSSGDREMVELLLGIYISHAMLAYLPSTVRLSMSERLSSSDHPLLQHPAHRRPDRALVQDALRTVCDVLFPVLGDDILFRKFWIDLYVGCTFLLFGDRDPAAADPVDRAYCNRRLDFLVLACSRPWVLSQLLRHVGPRSPQWLQKCTAFFLRSLLVRDSVPILVKEWTAGRRSLLEFLRALIFAPPQILSVVRQAIAIPDLDLAWNMVLAHWNSPDGAFAGLLAKELSTEHLAHLLATSAAGEAVSSDLHLPGTDDVADGTVPLRFADFWRLYLADASDRTLIVRALCTSRHLPSLLVSLVNELPAEPTASEPVVDAFVRLLTDVARLNSAMSETVFLHLFAQHQQALNRIAEGAGQNDRCHTGVLLRLMQSAEEFVRPSTVPQLLSIVVGEKKNNFPRRQEQSPKPAESAPALPLLPPAAPRIIEDLDASRETERLSVEVLRLCLEVLLLEEGAPMLSRETRSLVQSLDHPQLETLRRRVLSLPTVSAAADDAALPNSSTVSAALVSTSQVRREDFLSSVAAVRLFAISCCSDADLEQLFDPCVLQLLSAAPSQDAGGDALADGATVSALARRLAAFLEEHLDLFENVLLMKFVDWWKEPLATRLNIAEVLHTAVCCFGPAALARLVERSTGILLGALEGFPAAERETGEEEEAPSDLFLASAVSLLGVLVGRAGRAARGQVRMVLSRLCSVVRGSPIAMERRAAAGALDFVLWEYVRQAILGELVDEALFDDLFSSLNSAASPGVCSGSAGEEDAGKGVLLPQRTAGAAVSQARLDAVLVAHVQNALSALAQFDEAELLSWLQKEAARADPRNLRRLADGSGLTPSVASQLKDRLHFDL